jgi:hypothetical protein
MSEHAYDPELKAVEAALARLTPASPAVDRDRLMFRAGQAARPPRQWLWPTATAALALVSLGLTLLLAQRPAVVFQERLVYVVVPPPPSLDPPTAASTTDATTSEALAAYHRLQEQVLQHGLDGIPEPPPSPPSRLGDLEKLLGVPPVGWPRSLRSGT